MFHSVSCTLVKKLGFHLIQFGDRSALTSINLFHVNLRRSRVADFNEVLTGCCMPFVGSTESNSVTTPNLLFAPRTNFRN
jgi:hypothetical protein